MPRPTTVALALGSGGARGYAHIGVIEVLRERGFDIVCIAGSSMGALVGALCAADRLEPYTEWVLGLSQFDVVRLLDPSMSAPGAIRAEKILARVRELLGDARIEDFDVPFTAVATDLFARKEVWFQRGPVDVAVRASIAIPGVITPVMLNGRLLVDGGVMDPVPIAPTSAVQADVTLAVSLAGDEAGEPGPGGLVVETAEGQPVEEWADRFRRTAASLLDHDLVRSVLGRFGGADDVAGDSLGEAGDGAPVHAGDVDVPADDRGVDVFGDLPEGLSKLEVMNLSVEAMQRVITRQRLAAYPPDVLVEVPKDACRSLDFHRAGELIARGRSLAESALDDAGVAPTT